MRCRITPSSRRSRRSSLSAPRIRSNASSSRTSPGPACAEAHFEEIGIEPLRRDREGFRWRAQAQIGEGRSWVWLEGDTILFKAEASAWTPQAVQLQQVWVAPSVRNRGYGKRGMRDLCRRLLEQTPPVCLFVRPANAPALRLSDPTGMRRTSSYPSL